MTWVDEYRPQKLSDIVGNDDSIKSLVQWANGWEPPGDAVLLYGQPGIGKTTAAHALARQYNWESVEMNASDKRTRKEVQSVAGSASENQSLTGGSRKLIIVDEADNFHGNSDRGGSKAIGKIIKESQQPIVLIANDLYGMSRSIRNNCETIEFKAVGEKAIAKHLKRICDDKGIDYSINSLRLIAENSQGDVRSAVTDLQAIASGRDSIKDLSEGDLYQRNQEVGIFEFLDSLFKEDTAQDVHEDVREVDETPDRLINWIEENVAKVYDPDELADAYDFLSNADVWLGRVRKTQNYKYWRYASDNMTAGVAASRKRNKGGWTRFQPPKWRSPDNTRMEVARKVGMKSGTSSRSAFTDILPFLSVMTHHCKNKELTIQMAAHYDLDESEVATITGSGESTNKVQGIVEEAKDRRRGDTEKMFTILPERNQRDKVDTSEDDEPEAEAEEEKEDDDVEENITEEEYQADSAEEEDEEDDDDGQRGLDEFL